MRSSPRPTLQQRRRGMSLIEVLVASVVLLVGLVGIIQGVLVAMQQNAHANRMTEATALARSTVSGLQSLGRARLLATTGVLGTSCTASTAMSADQKALTGGLEAVQNAGGTLSVCFRDLDAFDAAAANDLARTLPRERTSERDRFRRVALHLTDSDTAVSVSTVTVVVSWMSMGRRNFVRQSLALYDPAVNQTSVEY